jgi:RNA-directed DNA polymerase
VAWAERSGLGPPFPFIQSGSNAMWLKAFFRWLVWGRGHDVDELARRLGVEAKQLRRFEPRYREFTVPKRSGGRRRILAPDNETKRLQRRLLRRLLARLSAHPAAMGFERKKSIVTNAKVHQGQAVVLRFDLKDFFPSTRAKRVKRYFRRIGWNRRATRVLLRLCTWEGGLPQGAPTSPRLSNLVNYRLDARLAGMAARLGGVYTRYADDMTVSFPEEDANVDESMVFTDVSPRTGDETEFHLHAPSDKIRYFQVFVRRVVEESGYRLHRRKKLSIRRRHQCQMVTGLVVNDRVNLPRSTRRWLRAVEHRMRLAGQKWLTSSQPPSYRPPKRPTLTPAQLEGWRALRSMIARQSSP